MITPKDVEHMASLSRIHLSKEEKQKFEKELSTILSFVEKLNEVDTSNIHPVTGGTKETNVVRDDSLTNNTLEYLSTKMMQQVSDIKENWVKVRAIFQ